jgi:hypothetical protein
VTPAELITRLKGVRRSGNGWLARCPSHEDRSPSLSVHEGEDGRVLLHDFAGCSVEAICAAVGIRVSDLFSERGKVQPKPRIVRDAEEQIANLRSRLTPTERTRPVTVIFTTEKDVDVATRRGLVLSVRGEIVQIALKDDGR